MSTSPRLEVRVVVTNRGDRAAAPLEITGELLGERQNSTLASVAPGRSGAAILSYSGAGARLGVHALTLLLEHPIAGPPDGAGNPPLASERAWLLIALGSKPAPAVRLEPQSLQLQVAGRLVVLVSSADGAAHRVRLTAWPARGLRAEAPQVVEVPRNGAIPATLPLVRAGAPLGSRHAVLVVGEIEDGPLARTSVASTTVEVAPYPSTLRRWRPYLIVLAALLLIVSAVGEVLGRRRA